MGVNTMYERYTVLNHSFDTLKGACEYIQQIVVNGKCKVLPTIKGWQDNQLLIEWLPTVDKYGGLMLTPKLFACIKEKEALA